MQSRNSFDLEEGDKREKIIYFTRLLRKVLMPQYLYIFIFGLEPTLAALTEDCIAKAST